MGANVLGQKDLLHFETLLRGLHGSVSRDLELLEKEAVELGHERHVRRDDEGSDEWAEVFNLQLLQRDDSLLRDIAEALRRLRAGKFGSCEECGGPIRRERLEEIPWTHHCLSCQRAEEAHEAPD